MLNEFNPTRDDTLRRGETLRKRRIERRREDKRARSVDPDAAESVTDATLGRFTLREFMSRYSAVGDTTQFAQYLMDVSVREYLTLLAEATGDDRWLEKIDYLLHYSDADEEYRFRIATAGSDINENVTVGELLMVANKLYEYADNCDEDDYDYLLYKDEDFDVSSDSENIRVQCEYIVYTLMIEPFNHIGEIQAYLDTRMSTARPTV